jgi:hypothetical protein
MSYVRLNITDKRQTIHDDVHGYFGDALVAALAAEPETVKELGAALARFIKPVSDGSPFERFKEGGDFEPYDAGVVVIDLAARVVASDSSYSQASAERRREEFHRQFERDWKAGKYDKPFGESLIDSGDDGGTLF